MFITDSGAQVPSASMMETSSGIFFDVVNPTPEMVRIDDIAWSLSRQARFAGHTLSEEVYSVAQHSSFTLMLADQALNGKRQGEGAFELSLHQWLAAKNFDADLVLEAFRGDPYLLMKTLMHDGSEAYLVDLPTPVKRTEGLLLPYRAIEDRVMTAIYSHLEINAPTPMEQEVIHWADLMALQIEAAHMLPSRGRSWSIEKPLAYKTSFNFFKEALPWKLAYENFLTQFYLIEERIGKASAEF